MAIDPGFFSQVYSGRTWTGTLGQGAEVQYTFGSSGSAVNLLDINPAFRAAVDRASNEISRFANIKFDYVPPSLFGNTTQAEAFISFNEASFTSNGVLDVAVSSDSANLSGNSTIPVTDIGVSFEFNQPGYALVMKAMGLMAGLIEGGDSTDVSVMSTASGTFTDLSFFPPGSFMIYDIAALQRMYGANESTNAGNDVYDLTTLFGAFTIWDAGGDDAISAQSFTSGVVINLQESEDAVTQSGGNAIWIAVGADIENAYGGAGADTLTGNPLDNLIYGGDGSDTIAAGELNDTVNGNQGNDTISGGGGNDSLRGGKDNDSIESGGGNNFVLGDLGNDTLSVGDGGNMVYGGDGQDSITVGAANDSINGNQGNDTIDAGAGNDTMRGGQNRDFLQGGQGEDSVMGDLGQDTIVDGVGSDSVHGGAGRDIFVFSEEGGGNDRVMDFTGGEDLLDFRGFFSDFDELAENISFTTDDATRFESAGNVLILLGEGENIGSVQSVELVNVTAVVSSDFFFPSF